MSSLSRSLLITVMAVVFFDFILLFVAPHTFTTFFLVPTVSRSSHYILILILPFACAFQHCALLLDSVTVVFLLQRETS